MNHLLAYADYGCALRYEPRSALETELTVTWLVQGDANPSVDYDLDRLTCMWRVTVAEDLRTVSENRRGVSSSAYASGPYVMPIESTTLRLTDWYLQELSQGSSTAHVSASYPALRMSSASV